MVVPRKPVSAFLMHRVSKTLILLGKKAMMRARKFLVLNDIWQLIPKDSRMAFVLPRQISLTGEEQLH